MRDTRVIRDSAEANLRSMGLLREARDREGLAEVGKALAKQAKALEKADREFGDKRVKPILTKEQWEQYRHYEKEREKEAAEREQEARPREPRGGGGRRRPG